MIEPKPELDRAELEKKLRDKIVTLAVGIMIIVGKLKPDDLKEEDKDRFETICEATKKQILALIPDEIEPDSGRLLTINEWLDAIGCDRAYRKDMKETYKKTIPELQAQRDLTASIKDAECQARERKLLSQMSFEKKDAHIFDTSYGYNQVRIDNVFLNEDSELWQALKQELNKEINEN